MAPIQAILCVSGLDQCLENVYRYQEQQGKSDGSRQFQFYAIDRQRRLGGLSHGASNGKASTRPVPEQQKAKIKDCGSHPKHQEKAPKGAREREDLFEDLLLQATSVVVVVRGAVSHTLPVAGTIMYRASCMIFDG